MRGAGRLKLGYFPLPIEGAHNIRGSWFRQRRMQPSIPVSVTVRRRSNSPKTVAHTSRALHSMPSEL